MPCHRARCDESCLPSRSGAPGAGREIRWLALGAAVLAAVAGSAIVPSGPAHGRRQRGAHWLSLSSRLLLRALGIRLAQRGSPPPGAALVVANHVSWLDALVLAAAARTVPVAKSEVLSWPVVGPLATRTGAIFVDRVRWRSLPATVDEITVALRGGYRVQVFPEGTTRCGDALNPFRRAAFRAAVDAAVPVAPAAIRYVDATGRRRAECAFVGEMTVLESVRRIVSVPPVTVEVTWLPAIAAVSTGHPASDRAMAARRAEHAVALGLGVPVIRRVPAPPRLAPVPSPVVRERPRRDAFHRVA